MDKNAFAAYLHAHPRVGDLIRQAGAPPREKRRLGFVTDAIVLVFMLPVTRAVLLEAGLPWLGSGLGYDDNALARFARWLQATPDPDGRIKAAGLKLMAKLEKVDDPSEREAWEGLRRALAESGSN